MMHYRPCLVTACQLKADIVFVLDVSTSVGARGSLAAGDKRFKVVTDFVSNVADFLTIGPDDTLIGVILFVQTAVLNFSVTTHTVASDLQDAINSIVYSEITNPDPRGTNTPAALDLLRTAGQRGGELALRRDNPDINQIAVILTDGVANNGPLNGRGIKLSAKDTEIAADKLKKANIYDFIFAVGVLEEEKMINENQLKDIATDRLVFVINDFDRGEFKRLQKEFTNVVCESK